MSVISGNGAEELDLILSAPWFISHNAMCHSAGNGIVHHVQAGISVNDNGGRIHLHHIRQKLLGLVDTGENAIVAAVSTVFAGQVIIAAEHIHHPHGKIQLLHAWLAPGHIQL